MWAPVRRRWRLTSPVDALRSGGADSAPPSLRAYRRVWVTSHRALGARYARPSAIKPQLTRGNGYQESGFGGGGPCPAFPLRRWGSGSWGLVVVGRALKVGVSRRSAFEAFAARARHENTILSSPYVVVGFPCPLPPYPPPLRSLRSLSGGGCALPPWRVCSVPSLLGGGLRFGRGRGLALCSAWAPRPVGAPRRPRSPSLPSPSAPPLSGLGGVSFGLVCLCSFVAVGSFACLGLEGCLCGSAASRSILCVGLQRRRLTASPLACSPLARKLRERLRTFLPVTFNTI